MGGGCIQLMMGGHSYRFPSKGGGRPLGFPGGGTSPQTLCISHKQLVTIIGTMFTQSLYVVLGWHSQYTASPNLILNK